LNYCIMLKGRDIINRFLLKNYIEISSMYPVFFTLHFYKQKISRDIHCSLNQSTSCSCYESNINYLSNTTFRGPLWLNRGHLTSPLWKHPFLNIFINQSISILGNLHSFLTEMVGYNCFIIFQYYYLNIKI
jgi:hypothetical protein